MKSQIPKSFVLALAYFLLPISFCVAQSFHLVFPPSPGDAITGSNTVLAYIASWCATNTPGTNWTPFYRSPAGQTNIPIPSSVPSPALIRIQAEGTNYILSQNTNWVLYNTNASWSIITNQIIPPAPPGPAMTITNH
jgi:hypothetical protein